MKTKQTKQKEALGRIEENKKLTIAQKILKLDLLYGDGKGAKKERQKLANQLIKESEGRVAKVQKEEKETKKPYQKPKRS